jgi:pimeloyl-ACP methyl ester carboxylesterase
MRADAGALAAALRGMGTGGMEPMWDELGRLEPPALLVAGALDVKYAALARAMAALLPAAEVALVAGAGHAVQVEAPAALATRMEEFLRRVETGGSARA